MRKAGQILQVAFTYIGTIVGAGFASGQEILQFFTRYGWTAVFAVAVSSLLFIWIGIKLMLLAGETGASSYEELGRILFGKWFGQAFGWFLAVVLLGTSAVMLAGAGSLFREQLHLPYQAGLLLTLLLGYAVIIRGMNGIVAVNSVVVPVMLAFIAAVAVTAARLPSAGNWLTLAGDYPAARAALSPLLYAAFNLATAQAVLVPLGAAVRDRSVLRWGGLLGGAGIGAMLLAAHFALSAQMPGIVQYDIPMGQLIRGIGPIAQLLFTLVIFGEIFTTFVADVYGLSLQIEEKTRLGRRTAVIGILGVSYAVSLLGFSSLLSVLYPLFGAVSLAWLGMLLLKKHSRP